METAPVFEETLQIKASQPTDIRTTDINGEYSVQFNRFVEIDSMVLSTSGGGSNNMFFQKPFFDKLSVAAAMREFRTYNAGFEIKIVYTGATNYLGLVRFYLSYRPKSTRYNPLPILPDYNGYVSSSTTPHIDIDLSTTGEYTLKVPYVGIDDVITKAENDWKLYARMQVPMQKADGTTPPSDLTFRIFVKATNLRTAILFESGEVSNFTVSAAMAYMSRLAKASNLPYATPVSMALKMGAGAAGALGYSRPTETIKENVYSREVAGMAVTSGQADFSHVLGVNPNSYGNVGEDLPMGSADDMDIYKLSRKWCQIGAFIGEAGHLSLAPDRLGYYSPKVENTVLSWLCRYFSFWTGELEVKLVIPCSPLIRWRLGVVILPPGKAPVANFPTEGFITHIVEVAGSTEVTFTIPWLYPENWAALTDKNPLDSNLDEVKIQVFSLSTPTGPSPTPVYPYVIPFCRAGENFSFGQLNYRVSPYTFEGGEAAAKQFGEDIRSLKEIAARSHNVYIGNTPAIANKLFFPVQPVVYRDSDSRPPGFSVYNGLNWMGLPFLGVRGSYRYTFFKTSLVSVSEGFNNYPFWSEVDYPDSDIYQLLERNIGEWRNADKSDKRFNYPNAAPGEEVGRWKNRLYYTTTAIAPCRLHVAGGDDYRLAGFIGIPVLNP